MLGESNTMEYGQLEAMTSLKLAVVVGQRGRVLGEGHVRIRGSRHWLARLMSSEAAQWRKQHQFEACGCLCWWT